LLREGERRITVAPLFMAQGGHVKEDLREILDAIRREHRNADIVLLPTIGDVDGILNAISDWLLTETKARS
jgi:sirohydrochlorin cobaltochelatase